ncbi:MAG: hypothetical protein ACREII_05375 [Nitrospiraceae bacterium]
MSATRPLVGPVKGHIWLVGLPGAALAASAQEVPPGHLELRELAAHRWWPRWRCGPWSPWRSW